MKRKIVFLTGTRADFGKMKSLISITSKSKKFEVHIFATGMHMNEKYGFTINEIIKCGYKNIFKYENHTDNDTMDNILAKTIIGFSEYIHNIKPDLIIVHGDRAETLAGAIVGSLNNILVVHIEGGELSGTVDEHIRHSVTKLSHVHFVSNNIAKKRIIQMGEDSDSIYIIGSPDIDIIESKKLPSLNYVKNYYNVNFKNYAILMFHPVTTELKNFEKYVGYLVSAIIESGQNYIAIFPNNDTGADLIFKEYARFEGNKKIKIFPSIRFEYFLVLIKNSNFIIGNSSAGIMEAPYYAVPTINIGSRQFQRLKADSIIDCGYGKNEILYAIDKIRTIKISKKKHFGAGNSDKKFIEIISNNNFFKVSIQKYFKDLK